MKLFAGGGGVGGGGDVFICLFWYNQKTAAYWIWEVLIVLSISLTSIGGAVVFISYNTQHTKWQFGVTVVHWICFEHFKLLPFSCFLV